MEKITFGGMGKDRRVIMLDEIRGFAIICMVFYHAMFDLKYIFNVDVPFIFDGWFDVVRDVFAGVFIFISGIMCRYSRDNVKRGAACFLLGTVITFVVPFFTTFEVQFGILHLLGISMMLYGLFAKPLEKIPAFIGIIVSAALTAVTWSASEGFIGIKGIFEWQFPGLAKKVGVLFPLGIHGTGFESADYFPMMPWFFLFLAGSYAGYWFRKGAMPQFFYNSHCRWLAAVGRVTIWIYVAHAPILFAIFSLIFH